MATIYPDTDSYTKGEDENESYQATQTSEEKKDTSSSSAQQPKSTGEKDDDKASTTASNYNPGDQLVSHQWTEILSERSGDVSYSMVCS